jgi:indole-3-glycerol phosphate synthase/phosphoribosylanthranilate isomerase
MDSSSTSHIYSQEELRNALDSLLSVAGDQEQDEGGGAAHLYVADPNDPLKLSMLQKITATVILDYEHYLASGRAPSVESLLVLSSPITKGSRRTIRNLNTVIRQRQPTMALAAEFKRASPSKGQILADGTISAAQQGLIYANAGADIISVLTERRWFQGSLQDLSDIRTAVGDDICLLRKDFVVNEYMIAEAVAAGADTVLLIVAVLPAPLLRRLINYCRRIFDIEPLVEIHDVDLELPVALAAGARVIGVNNRNLHTFQMDMTTTERVAARLQQLKQQEGIPPHHNNHDITLCALSGMSTAADVDRYRRQAACQMVLIGESLMRSTDPAQAIRSLCLDPADYDSQQQQQQQKQQQQQGRGGAYTGGTQLIKVCGITNPTDALAACQAGAQLIGIIFVPTSPRCVASSAIATAIVDTVRSFGERTTTTTRLLATTNDNHDDVVVRRPTRTELVDAVRKRPAVVGVFQNQPGEYIRRMVSECGLDLVQLHGNEGMKAANYDNYGVPVIRVVDIAVHDEDDGSAVPVKGEFSSSSLSSSTTTRAAQKILDQVTDDPALILLDTAIKGAAAGGGGTGVVFDWSIVEQLQNAGLPVLVAGGLNADNVADCIQQTRPFGVDVSSGVESSNKGVKDHAKVRAFVSNAKKAAVEAAKGF